MHEEAPAADADIRELARRFETAFAELGGADEMREPARAEADLFPDFSQDIFQDVPVPEVPASPAVTAESARVFAMPRREGEPAGKPAAKPARAPAESKAADEVTLDEAFSILRASENKAATAARPEEGERPKARSAKREESGGRADNPHGLPTPSDPVFELRPPTTGGADWATKSHRVRTWAIAASVGALVVGLGAGYLYGHTPAPQTPAAATIGASQQGGTALRLDRDLHQR